MTSSEKLRKAIEDGIEQGISYAIYDKVRDITREEVRRILDLPETEVMIEAELDKFLRRQWWR